MGRALHPCGDWKTTFGSHFFPPHGFWEPKSGAQANPANLFTWHGGAHLWSQHLAGRSWWAIPLNWSQPVLQKGFQDIQGFIEKPWLQTDKQKVSLPVSWKMPCVHPQIRGVFSFLWGLTMLLLLLIRLGCPLLSRITVWLLSVWNLILLSSLYSALLFIVIYLLERITPK